MGNDYKIPELKGFQGVIEPGDNIIYQGHLSLVSRAVDPNITDPNMKVLRHDVVVSKNAAIMMYIDENDFVYFAKQIRPAMRREMYSFPAETLDKPNKSPIEVMAEGLEEEIGISLPLSQIEYICSLDSSDGHDTEMVHCFKGFGKGKYVGQRLEDSEKIEVVKMPFTEAYNLLQENIITGAKTAYLIQHEYNKRQTEKIRILELQLTSN